MFIARKMKLRLMPEFLGVGEKSIIDARIDGLVRTGQPLSRLQMDLFQLQNVVYLLGDYCRELARPLYCRWGSA